VHKAMWDHARQGHPAQAVAFVPRLDGWAAEALNSGHLADLYWHFCEGLGDAMAQSDPQLAARLYALAEVSIVKEGSYATGAGEGYMAMSHLELIRDKLAALRR